MTSPSAGGVEVVVPGGKSNCENLFSKIAEPNPIFYKDRKSRMQKQIYLHFPEAEF